MTQLDKSAVVDERTDLIRLLLFSRREKINLISKLGVYFSNYLAGFVKPMSPVWIHSRMSESVLRFWQDKRLLIPWFLPPSFFFRHLLHHVICTSFAQKGWEMIIHKQFPNELTLLEIKIVKSITRNLISYGHFPHAGIISSGCCGTTNLLSGVMFTLGIGLLGSGLVHSPEHQDLKKTTVTHWFRSLSRSRNEQEGKGRGAKGG